MKRHLVQLDSLRGIAALTVVFSHLLYIFPYFEPNTSQNTDYFWLNIVKYSPLHIFFDGHGAVILFFVLSGFVLALPYYRESFKLEYIPYVIKRFFRIYVPYIVTLVFAFLLAFPFIGEVVQGGSDFVSRGWNKEIAIQDIWNHILFIGNYDTRDFHPVIWSLIHEMRISIIFPFIMMLVLRLNWKSVLCFAVFLSVMVEVASLDYTIHYIGIFMVGALLAKYYQTIVDWLEEKNTLFKGFLFLLGACFYSYSFLFYNVSFAHNFIIDDWFTAIGSVIFISISLASIRATNVLKWKPIHFIGKISYSLYLVHLPIILFMVHLLANLIPTSSILLLSFVVSLLVASLCYYFIEIPSIKMGAKMASRIKKREK
ncbi:Peptidoglycan/LPS O-acetylase OafA/YrhL, contains acyltransferase and SGNH-hydrolase domains [Thermoactinomyces sp. DSM 45891]|uniref:acyltransferase family protein n=1 Tax=Thermoactinomyces sp. DSM 45891 TaxID=1761907 RepID=UPI0009248289|nr:acyltransferase [Thermoactinomyces sp. DSM 45891]SFX28131.1 Peptidoglycan/LPS O-acetylase OafA/YrhL, contains acyltransferase and SGNH-hydrolase domains [Thermoactinomyces sp. DSM 45891]